MALTLDYQDAYLTRHCTEERETRALADVDREGEFAEAWRNKLGVLRCYILVCLEKQAEPDDLFAAKLKQYRVEYDGVLAKARASLEDDEGNPLSVLSVPILRG